MDKRIKQIMTAFVILGLLVSIYMTIYKITDNENMCIGSGGCSVVNASKYAIINGIPVAAVGIVGYAAILAVLWLERKPGFIQENGTMILFALTMLGFLFTIWLVFVEIALIKAYCPFCITSQISMTLIFILTVVRVIRQP